jgi:hypothetical protein
VVSVRHIPPGWWNGRHGRLKSGCPKKACGFETRPGHAKHPHADHGASDPVRQLPFAPIVKIVDFGLDRGGEFGGGVAGDCDPDVQFAGGVLDHGEYVHLGPAQRDRFDGVAGQQRVGLRSQEAQVVAARLAVAL